MSTNRQVKMEKEPEVGPEIEEVVEASPRAPFEDEIRLEELLSKAEEEEAEE